MLIYVTDGAPRWIKLAMAIAGDVSEGDVPILPARRGGLRLLLSYHYFKRVDLDKMLGEFKHPPGEVFADSGAFSAKTLGAEITIDEYAAWLNRWRHWFGPMANLDVIGDHEATMANQAKLEDMGLPVLPVFHVGTDFEHLDGLADRYNYIALGGMVGRPVSILGRWAAKCHDVVGDRARFHGFGMTSWPVMLRFPWRSVDSSSWGQGHRFGTLSIFDPVSGNWSKFRVGTKEPIAHARLFRQLGCEPMDFVDRRRFHATKAIELSIRSWAKAAKYLSRIRSREPVHKQEMSMFPSGNTEYSLPSRRQATARALRQLYLAGDTKFTSDRRRPVSAAAFKEVLDDDT